MNNVLTLFRLSDHRYFINPDGLALIKDFLPIEVNLNKNFIIPRGKLFEILTIVRFSDIRLAIEDNDAQLVFKF